VIILGHGRAGGPWPLNSLGSFRAAREAGADGVELDVRRTADDALVAHHDAVLADGRALAETPLDELPADIATLEQVLDVCAGLIVNIEVKNYPEDSAYDPGQRLTDITLALLANRGGRDRVIVSSFGSDTLAHVRSRAASLDTAALLFHRAPPWDQLAAIAAAGHP
jgi:glycerophosphoryl diester phosphodiesterase